MILGRRKFLAGLGAMLAAPAIVHAGNLMPIKALPQAPVVSDIYAQLADMLRQRMEECSGLLERQIAESVFRTGTCVVRQVDPFFRSIVLPEDFYIQERAVEVVFER